MTYRIGEEVSCVYRSYYGGGIVVSVLDTGRWPIEVLWEGDNFTVWYNADELSHVREEEGGPGR